MIHRLRTFALTVLCLLPLHTLADDAVSDPLLRLEKGAFYFHYLNDDYQPALNSLARLKTLEGSVSGETRLMEAAILLALGLTDDAAGIFRDVRELSAPADSWFYVARALFAQGRYEDSELAIQRAFSSVSLPALSAKYYDEARYILVSALAHQDRINDAMDQLANMPDASIWTGYARYNLIIARMRLYTPGRDLGKLVEEAVYYLPKNYEGQALKDRVLLVAGIHALETGKAKEAETYLAQMSQDSPFAAPGLLQYGWALVEQWRYEEALQPWRILQQRFQPFHPAVMESVLGVPHALELLNATTQSLKTYEMVEGRLQSLLDQLGEQNKPAVINAWLGQWLAMQDGEWGWQRTRITDMPDTPLSATLQALLDDSAFTSAAFRLHELTAMLAATEQQQADMQLWSDTLIRRQQALKSVQGAKQLAALEQRRASLSSVLDALSARLAAEDNKVFAYASSADEQNVQRLQRVVPNVDALQKIATPTRDLLTYKERWRRARGLELWQIYEFKPERQWQANNAYWALQSDISDLQEQLNNTRAALTWADSSWQGFPQQVITMQQRLAQQKAQLARLRDAEQAGIQRQIQDYLDSLTVRITDYLAQTRLSVARLYDDALQKNIAELPLDEPEDNTPAEPSTDTQSQDEPQNAQQPDAVSPEETPASDAQEVAHE
ncbi:hypothetical protein ACQUQU_07300 [Thalassolituus sp. LLYu03]|uniref:hypothetical protein n=1 Tax=Thalassolituus sp. LLYu03 TaxID=3421656 RepID=UPI003D26F9E4